MASHCPENGSPDKGEESGTMIDCAVACAALHSSEPPASEPVELVPAEAVSGPHPVLSGILPEGEKRPPRITLEI